MASLRDRKHIRQIQDIIVGGSYSKCKRKGLNRHNFVAFCVPGAATQLEHPNAISDASRKRPLDYKQNMFRYLNFRYAYVLFFLNVVHCFSSFA